MIVLAGVVARCLVVGAWGMFRSVVGIGCCYLLFYIAGFFIMWIRYHRSLNLEAIAKVSTGKCAMIRYYGFDRKRDSVPKWLRSTHMVLIG